MDGIFHNHICIFPNRISMVRIFLPIMLFPILYLLLCSVIRFQLPDASSVMLRCVQGDIQSCVLSFLAVLLILMRKRLLRCPLQNHRHKLVFPELVMLFQLLFVDCTIRLFLHLLRIFCLMLIPAFLLLQHSFQEHHLP